MQNLSESGLPSNIDILNLVSPLDFFQQLFLSADSFSSVLLVRLEVSVVVVAVIFSKVWEGKEEFANRPVQEIHNKGLSS